VAVGVLGLAGCGALVYLSKGSPGEGDFNLTVTNDTPRPVILVEECWEHTCTKREQRSYAARHVVARLAPNQSATVTAASGGDELPPVLVLTTNYAYVGCLPVSFENIPGDPNAYVTHARTRGHC
jgi:hypothetical protein